jgi:predicted DNA-binding transcriptional regulator AlpA
MARKKEEPMESVLLSTSQCAERKGVSPQAIWAAIQRGDLPAIKLGRFHFVNVSDLEAYTPVLDATERGRLRHAKNANEEPQPVKRGRGRPPGSKNKKPAALSLIEPEEEGKPS